MITRTNNVNTNINEILEELCARVDNGMPNFSNKKHLNTLTEILKENNWPESAIKVFVRNLWLIATSK